MRPSVCRSGFTYRLRSCGTCCESDGASVTLSRLSPGPAYKDGDGAHAHSLGLRVGSSVKLGLERYSSLQ